MQLSEFFYILYILCTVFWPSLMMNTSVCPAKVMIRHSPFQPRHEALAESSLRLNSHYYNEVTRIQFPALMWQRISFFCRSGVNIKIWPFQIRPGSAFMYSPRLDTYPVWCLVTWMRASDWNLGHFFPPQHANYPWLLLSSPGVGSMTKQPGSTATLVSMFSGRMG